MVDHDASAIPPDDAIDIDVPLRASHAATVRLLIASLGADAGFSIDEIDDLKLAVSEVFTLLTENAPADGNHRARLRLLIEGPSFVIELRDDRSPAPIELDPLSATILASVTDEHQVDVHGVRLVKRLAESTV
ncbi:ATP-binding protein [Ilumatobacter nonamiensis]|uniref:ATP-binding protein n=1 Tax=Ilumatobacter nonamiensis TaxID=467093 RepID=UPI00058AD1A7|nr:ATP-binding protein [Ilumatobacter nonamiensis]